jgi:hypothetical protein
MAPQVGLRFGERPNLRRGQPHAGVGRAPPLEAAGRLSYRAPKSSRPGGRDAGCDSLASSSGVARFMRAPKWRHRMPFAPELLGGYFAARSFGASVATACSLGASAGAASGSGGGRPNMLAENRAMSQERNKATASLLRSSGWVVR